MSNSNLRYRPDIDGLRAIAIFTVVMFHAFPNLLGGGFVGVDVFFVISGYLITTVILGDLPLDGSRQDSFSFATFYAHRIRRIFPALILVLTACLVFGWFVLLAEEYKQLGKQAVAGALFVENFSLWGEADYFDKAAELKPLLHLWSLGVEEQFYIVWPILLIVAVRLRVNLLWLAIGIFIASFAANLITVREHAVAAAFYSPLTRMWELMIGGIYAYAKLHRQTVLENWERKLLARCFLGSSPQTIGNIKSGAGLMLILVAAVFLDKTVGFPGWWALLPTVGACLIISAGQNAWVNRHILASRPFVFLGLISYPLYLWHWPLLSFAHILGGNTLGTGLRVVLLMLAVVLAWLTYRLVERRLRRKEGWAVMVSLACILMAIAGGGLNIFERDGLEFRLKGSELQRVKFNTTLHYQTQCRRDFKFAENSLCMRASEDTPPTVALLGDSHAATMYPGLGQYYAKRGENLVLFGLGGGIPFYGVERVIDGNVTNYYSKTYSEILDYVSNQATIKTVILMNKSLDPQTEQLKYKLDPDDVDTINIYGKAMARTIEKLIAAHKQVIFIIDNPMMDFDPGTCFARPSMLGAVRNPCAVQRSIYDLKIKRYRDKINEVLARFPSVKRWDPATYLCDAQYCWALKDGKMLYGRDGQHLTFAGSYWLADHFSPE